jgi:very-short-patch-repair endonuclease
MFVKPPLPTSTLGNARALRRDMTDAERRLWQSLRGGQLEGFKFRRQHPLPPYVADFCCQAARLIVEVDGSQHGESSDAARTRYLQMQGWRIVRFWSNDVLLATESVIEAIREVLVTPYPHPNPSPEGRGA